MHITLSNSLLNVTISHLSLRNLIKLTQVSSRFFQAVGAVTQQTTGISLVENRNFSSLSLAKSMFSNISEYEILFDQLNSDLIQLLLSSSPYERQVNIHVTGALTNIDEAITLLLNMSSGDRSRLLLYFPVNSDHFVSVRSLLNFKELPFGQIHVSTHSNQVSSLVKLLASSKRLSTVRISPAGHFLRESAISLVHSISQMKHIKHVVLHPYLLKHLPSAMVTSLSSWNVALSLVGISPIPLDRFSKLSPLFSKITKLNIAPFNVSLLQYTPKLMKLEVNRVAIDTSQDEYELFKTLTNLVDLTVSYTQSSVLLNILSRLADSRCLETVSIQGLLSASNVDLISAIDLLPSSLQSLTLSNFKIPRNSLSRSNFKKFKYTLKNLSIKGQHYVDDLKPIFFLKKLSSLFLSNSVGQVNITDDFSEDVISNLSLWPGEFKLSVVNCSKESLSLIYLLMPRISNLSRFVLIGESFSNQFLDYLKHHLGKFAIQKLKIRSMVNEYDEVNLVFDLN
ncbi:hypothetical protein RCL1_003503 [Eukaryota sp. TZLM3-RCL]